MLIIEIIPIISWILCLCFWKCKN